MDAFFDLINGEAGGFLAWRIFDEGLQKRGCLYDALSRQVGVLRHPVIVLIGDDVRALIRVHSEVEDFRNAQAGEGILPDGETTGLAHLAEG
ncbi:hypothetical protein D3C72_2169490 [compost metagenome]